MGACGFWATVGGSSEHGPRTRLNISARALDAALVEHVEDLRVPIRVVCRSHQRCPPHVVRLDVDARGGVGTRASGVFWQGQGEGEGEGEG